MKVKDSLLDSAPTLSGQEGILMQDISVASEQRKWATVQAHFGNYTGKSVKVYTAAMNAALRCRKYEEGAAIYE